MKHTARNLPHNHIFFELVVVACGSMIDTFCQLGYLTISEHKTSAMEIRVHNEYRDVAGLMIIPVPESLEVMYYPYSTTIHPNSAVSESTIAAKLFQPLSQPPSKRTRSKTKPPPATGLSKTTSTLQSKRSKRQKHNIPPNYRDKDDDGDEDYDDDKEYDVGDEGDDVGKMEDKLPGINSDESKWASRYKDTSFWPDKGGYNLEEWEFKEKEKWATPAACMDIRQRKTLEKSLRTRQKWASRYSQRPGQNWPAQEWVLLQITDIDGVGQKKASTSRMKTVVMDYGRSQAIEWYQKCLDSSGDTGKDSTSPSKPMVP
jgi:hypothetical protein